MITKKDTTTKKAVLALFLITASTVVNANLVPGIGAEAVATTTGLPTNQSCVTGFLMPTASCGVGTASASATVSNGTSVGDMTAQAAGGGWSDGIIQDTLYFHGSIPANGRGKLEMTATGTLTGFTSPTGSSYSAYATEDLWVGGFNVPGLLTPGNMLQGAVVTGNIQNTCYDPGINIGTSYGITLCVLSDGHNLGISWDFPLSSVPSTGLEFRAMLGCTAGAAGDTCNYQDPFTITLPAGVTFTSAANQLAPVPVPAAAWLFGSGLLGLVGVARRNRSNTSKKEAGQQHAEQTVGAVIGTDGK